MNTSKDQDPAGGDVLQEILARLDRLETALVLLAQAQGGEGEEGNESGPLGSDPNAAPSLATQVEQRNVTSDAALRRRLSVADQQATRVISSINAKNKQHYGLTH